jgi:rhodanese-related sulfurtransferase
LTNLQGKGFNVNGITNLKNVCAVLLGAISIATSAQPIQAPLLHHPRGHAESISPATLSALLETQSQTRLFVDVRGELPSNGDRNLPDNFASIRYRRGSGSQLNTSFALEVGNALAAKGLSIGAPIVLTCGDGMSSSEAAKWLVWVGHANAVFVQGGINELALAQKKDRGAALRPKALL